MGLLDIFKRKKPEIKDNQEQTSEKGLTPEQLARLEGYTIESAAGTSVTPEGSLQCSAVYAAVRVLAESVASLPCLVYRRLDVGGKDRSPNHAYYNLLHDRPNSWQTAFEFWEMVVTHLCLRGNAYIYKNKNGAGQVRELLPIYPDRVVVEQDPQWNIYYTISSSDGRIIGTFLQQDILHIRGLSLDGIVGLNPIAYHRNAIGLAMETEQYGSRYFKNNARPSGVLKHPNKLSEEAQQRLKEAWNQAHSGNNQRNTAILEEGMEWQQLSLSNEDGQFLDTRRFQIEEVARIFRVPAVLLQHADKTSTYASSEQFFLSFTKYTLMPWLRRIESALNTHLFGNNSKHFAEFLIDALERADAKTRAEFYASALQNEWMTGNEVRERENLNRVEGLDNFRNPSINPQERNNNADP